MKRLLLTIYCCVICITMKSEAQIDFTQHLVTEDYTEVWRVHAADLNNDNHVDIISALGRNEEASIFWWENDGNEAFSEYLVDNNFGGGARCWFVSSVDMDEDGDIDIIGCLFGGYSPGAFWWENDGGDPPNFDVHEITGYLLDPYCVYSTDLDSDEDIDVLVATSSPFDLITWWENDGDEDFTGHDISNEGDFIGANTVFAIDIDGDGDIDVIGGGGIRDYNGELIWWENDGEQEFTAHQIEDNFGAVESVFAIDLDGDLDIDIVSASMGDDAISWWENNGDQEFTQHIIVEDGNYQYNCVHPIDIDGDGDIDIVSSSTGLDGEFSWWENDGDQEFTEYQLYGDFSYALSVYATDIDGDAAIDIIGGTLYSEAILWWENNFNPRAPDNFELIHPEDGSTITEDTLTFIWSTAADPDPNDDIEYFLEWSSDSIFSENETNRIALEDTFYLVDSLSEYQAGSTIHWRVKAVDNFNLQ
ncbi:FG-GAP repeat domain-containing protein, partial [Calditrichota bacterium]